MAAVRMGGVLELKRGIEPSAPAWSPFIVCQALISS